MTIQLLWLTLSAELAYDELVLKQHSTSSKRDCLSVELISQIKVAMAAKIVFFVVTMMLVSLAMKPNHMIVITCRNFIHYVVDQEVHKVVKEDEAAEAYE